MGGGAISTSSSAIFTDCAFINCSVNFDEQVGGSIYADAFAQLVLTRVVFSGGRSKDGLGGAIYLDAYSSLIMNGVHMSNIDGGAIYARYGSSVKIINSIIQNCKSSFAAALVCYAPDEVSLIDSTFDSNTNTADNGFGGAVYVDSCPLLTISGCIL